MYGVHTLQVVRFHSKELRPSVVLLVIVAQLSIVVTVVRLFGGKVFLRVGPPEVV